MNFTYFQGILSSLSPIVPGLDIYIELTSRLEAEFLAVTTYSVSIVALLLAQVGSSCIRHEKGCVRDA